MTEPRRDFSRSATALTLFRDEELLAALSHEIANHLTAIRVHAELFELGSSPAGASRAVLQTAGRAGLLNACVRPLSEPGQTESTLHPLALLASVRDRIATAYDTRCPVETNSGRTLRSARGDLEDCTRALALLAVELFWAADCKSPLALSSSVTQSHTEITIGVQCARLPVVNPAHPGSGVVLAAHIAEAIARRHDGWVSLQSLPMDQSVSLWLPASE